MGHTVVGICIVAVVAIVALLIYRKKKMSAFEGVNTSDQDSGAMTIKQNSELSQPDKNLDELVIQMEMLPVEAIPDEGRLVEITDSKVLARVNNLVKGKLGHANFVAVPAKEGTAVVTNTAAAAMGVASMVVGQYYMTQINAKLGEISDGISKISEFQDNEFRSRVFSLITHVKKIADFQIEILENDELRLSKIAQLDSLEEECTQLLGQVNLTLAGFTKKNDLDYASYEKKLKEAQNWYTYQKVLLDVLYRISDLRYTLHMGAVSREQCTSLLPTFTKQVEDTQTLLTGWHQTSVKRLGIDIDEIRRKRAGLDGAIHFIPGLFNDDLNFRTIDEKTAGMITAQTAGQSFEHSHDISDLFSSRWWLSSSDCFFWSRNRKISSAMAS